jgi:hypothetical protein
MQPTMSLLKTLNALAPHINPSIRQVGRTLVKNPNHPATRQLGDRFLWQTRLTIPNPKNPKNTITLVQHQWLTPLQQRALTEPHKLTALQTRQAQLTFSAEKPTVCQNHLTWQQTHPANPNRQLTAKYTDLYTVHNQGKKLDYSTTLNIGPTKLIEYNKVVKQPQTEDYIEAQRELQLSQAMVIKNFFGADA